MARKKKVVVDDVQEEKKEYKIAEVYTYSKFYNRESNVWQDVHDSQGNRIPELKRTYTPEQSDPEKNKNGVPWEEIKGGGKRKDFVEKAKGFSTKIGGFVKLA